MLLSDEGMGNGYKVPVPNSRLIFSHDIISIEKICRLGLLSFFHSSGILLGTYSIITIAIFIKLILPFNLISYQLRSNWTSLMDMLSLHDLLKHTVLKQ